MKKSYLAALTVSALIFSSAHAASGDQVDHRGIYVGAAYGLLNVDGDDEDFDREDNATRIFAGAQFNQAISLEGGYIDFGNYGNSYSRYASSCNWRFCSDRNWCNKCFCF